VLSQLVPLVGRDAELGTLTLALDAAADGVTRVVTLEGDAGVGKTRLAGELAALARTRGFVTLHAVASPLHADLPYGVIVEALRPLVRTVEAGARARLIEGLPDLGRLFEGLYLPAPTPLGEAGLERTRLFEAVCRLLDRLTRQQPVLLVVDDIHWADPASLAMLLYVVRGLVGRRFLLVITSRSGESSDELDVLLSTLRRSALLVELDILRLDSSEVRAMAGALLADEPPSTLIELLVERTRGLPLFVRALVMMLLDSGRLFRSGGRWVLGQQALDDIPPELVGLLRSRLNVLGAADRAVFDIVAVAGGDIGHQLICALGPGEAEVLDCVRRLRLAGVLVEQLDDTGVRYQVTHPLLGEVAYEELPAVVRRRTHAAIAAALERLEPRDIGRLAHHVTGAGNEVDAGKALDVLVAALEAALEGKAGQQAVDHAEAAIGLARRLERVDLLPRLRGQRAEAFELAGHSDAAIEAWREAAETSTAAGRLVDAAHQLHRLSLVEWDTGHLADSQAHLDEATAMLAGAPMAAERLAVTETRLRMFARRGLMRELTAEIRTLDIAAASGSRQALALANLGRSEVCLRSGDHDGAERAISVVINVAREEGWILLLEEAHRPAVCNALAWGDHATARQLAEDGRRLARETSVLAGEIIDGFLLAFANFFSGAWDEASNSADSLLELSHRIGIRRGIAAALCVHAAVHSRRGQFAQANACLNEARAVYGEGFANDLHVLGPGNVCQAMVLLGQGDVQSALHLASTMTPGGVAVPAFCSAVLGEAQVTAGDLAGARDTARLIASHGPEAPYPAAVSAWINGLVARAAGDRAAASAAFDRAADRFATLAMPYEAMTARLDWAEVVATQTDSDEERVRAAALMTEHLAALDQMGARPVADRTRRLLRRLGARLAPRPRIRVPGQLSSRETEIARLVAEGLSNPEIADRLFISERTVTTHLQHVYQRLGVASRTGLTRYVLEHLSSASQNT
jgi:DNA-binding CsgD family transcriptional regulator/tetratricopeptide (TPR) repeat protein/biotin operon repressor